ncbi:BON domain-containing protein [Actinokineospora alba]|uniref:BON domain-containing protein n=1 Tax=Actinokineospora alba TaxID=504798 RepID=A0A1H0FP53_9PSEU|nr:CBS domain-containing protein [Actinokineospora alba]TDP69557.1 BON domain-containing protein [Actinokineospora alba]SDI14190.1 BON domain-containing protein [Actinokineospora alba]SDN96425.1 BON domain-containing protein [Actinokineospora alba]
MKVRDVMTRPVLAVRPDTPLREVITQLTERGFSALPVVDDDSQVVGIVGESDALRGSALGATTAGAVMSSPVEVVDPDSKVADLAERMLAGRLRCVPVVDNNILIGVVARRDLLRILVRTDDVIAAQLRALLADYSGNQPRWTAEVTDGLVTISGPFDDNAERRVVQALARTVAGVRGVTLRPRVPAEQV